MYTSLKCTWKTFTSYVLGTQNVKDLMLTSHHMRSSGWLVLPVHAGNTITLQLGRAGCLLMLS